MSRHPDHLPGPLRDWLDRHNTNATQLSLDMDCCENFVTSLFKGDQNHLQNYCRLADAGKLSLDDLVEVIKNGKIADYINNLISAFDKTDKPVYHRKGLGVRIGIKEATIRRIYNNKAPLIGIHSYLLLSEKTGLPLQVFRKSQSTALEKMTA